MTTLVRIAGSFLFYLYNNFFTNFPVYAVRHYLLKRIFKMQIGNQSSIHMGCFIIGRNISIGNHTVLNRKCVLDRRVGIHIGNKVSISTETIILSLTHDVNSHNFEPVGKGVSINDFVWIGALGLILPGVTLEEGCVVGAGSIVTKSVLAYTIVAGVPAKKVGERNRNLTYNPSYFPYFNTDVTKFIR